MRPRARAKVELAGSGPDIAHEWPAAEGRPRRCSILRREAPRGAAGAESPGYSSSGGNPRASEALFLSSSRVTVFSVGRVTDARPEGSSGALEEDQRDGPASRPCASDRRARARAPVSSLAMPTMRRREAREAASAAGGGARRADRAHRALGGTGWWIPTERTRALSRSGSARRSRAPATADSRQRGRRRARQQAQAWYGWEGCRDGARGNRSARRGGRRGVDSIGSPPERIRSR